MLFRRLNLSSEIFSRLLLPSCVFLPPATPPKGGWDGRQTRETHPAPADPERETANGFRHSRVDFTSWIQSHLMPAFA
jgi:hypothetical protein